MCPQLFMVFFLKSCSQSRWLGPVLFSKHSLLLSRKNVTRGEKQTTDCSQTESCGCQFRLGKYFSDERGLPFYYLKIRFLEYL